MLRLLVEFTSFNKVSPMAEIIISAYYEDKQEETEATSIIGQIVNLTEAIISTCNGKFLSIPPMGEYRKGVNLLASMTLSFETDVDKRFFLDKLKKAFD